MLYRVGTKKELYTSGCELPERVYTEVFQGVVVLDAEYGTERDSLLVGGFSLIAEESKDVAAIKNYVDYDEHPPEWVTRIGTTGYISAMSIMNNDFSIVLYMPESIAPKSILSELED